MSKVFFMNNGDFDVRAMCISGVSAKDSSDAIGYFGTGFKYAVSIVLRLGGKITVQTISGTYEFTSKQEEIRGKAFDLVCCNGVECGFTTRLGVNWKPWMAFRELYCNAKDEGGETSDTINLDYDTVISVECSEIFSAHQNINDYFLVNKTPVASISHRADIYDFKSQFIYYKGVAVSDESSGLGFTYNINSPIELTEDRTMKYGCASIIIGAWLACDDEKLIRRMLTSRSKESELDFNSWILPSKAFLSAAKSAIKTGLSSNKSLIDLVRKSDDENADWPTLTLNKVQNKMLSKALSFLKFIDVDASEYEIKTVTGMGADVMGRAVDGVIYLSELPFSMGTKQLASTILEEWVHIKFGHADFDRGMQNWLFDKILSVAEVIAGEPV